MAAFFIMINDQDLRKMAIGSAATLLAAMFVPVGVLVGAGVVAAGAFYAYHNTNLFGKKDGQDADFVNKDEEGGNGNG